MSARTPTADLGAEREIDLRRWRDAILARWWFVAAGLVAGLIIGGLYSLSGASNYQATVTIQPAQVFNPAGNPVLNYTSSPLAIQVLVTSSDALTKAAAKAHMPLAELQGHVSTSSISTIAGPVTIRGTVLIQVTVSLPQAKRAQDAANALGAYIEHATEGPYVKESLKIYQQRDITWTQRLNSAQRAINSYDSTIATTKLSAFDKLVLVTELDAAIERQGNLQDKLIANQQAQTLAQQIELAQIINPAAAAKVTSRSRGTSLLFGALIGVIVGAIVALVVGLRTPRVQLSR
jgi:uncharacterized protein involved in exopolysaccharide biosynthesis